eukprot:11767819-Karenia_brevis.AAC.1
MGLHAFSRAFLRSISCVDLCDVPSTSSIIIAIDGSAGADVDGTKYPASWALAIFSVGIDDECSFHECTAYIWALWWIINNRADISRFHNITICFDSLSAVYTSSGIWK